MEKETKQDRCRKANNFLVVLSSFGRRFFEYNGKIASFNVEKDGKIYFNNEWNGKRIYVSRYRSWKWFHHGGTLHAFVGRVVEYINTGKQLSHEYIDAHWGYRLDTISVVKAGVTIGIIEQSSNPSPVELAKLDAAFDRIGRYLKGPRPALGYGHPYEYQHLSGSWHFNQLLFEQDILTLIRNLAGVSNARTTT